MKPKFWILTGVLFLLSSSLWATYVISRRAFLSDFNAWEFDSYLSGHFAEAEVSLRSASETGRRPHNEQEKQLLTKVFIERSFAEYHQKNFSGALETLDRASQVVPMDEETRQTLASLRQQLSVPAEERPVGIEKVLDGLYHHLPVQDQPNNLQSVMEQWLKRSQSSQEALLQKFWGNQEHWLVQLEKEKDDFKKILYGGLIL